MLKEKRKARGVRHDGNRACHSVCQWMDESYTRGDLHDFDNCRDWYRLRIDCSVRIDRNSSLDARFDRRKTFSAEVDPKVSPTLARLLASSLLDGTLVSEVSIASNCFTWLQCLSLSIRERMFLAT